MSRCFPFPPPGYEKKGERDDIDLLTKEKRREKKHKKDKKDKEKREDKDRKKDKDRSEKHKEKKDRKEKHKHKKDGDKDKEKKTVDEKNIIKQFGGQNGGKPSSNHLCNGQTVESNFLQELGKRISDEGGARDNQLFQSTEQRSANQRGSIVEGNVGNSTEGKEKNKRKIGDGANVNGQRNKIEERVLETSFLNGFCGMEQTRVEVAGPVDKDVKKQMEGKEKHKHKNNSDNRGDGKKDRDSEKKSKSKNKDRIKEKENREMKEKQTNKEKLRLGENRKDIYDLSNIKPPQALNDNIKGSVHDVKAGKRKEPEMNGFVHDDDIRPNKMPRPMPSSHPLVENGRKLEPSQTSLQIALEKQLATNHKEEGKLSSCQQILQNGKKLEPHPGTIQSVSDMHGVANNQKISKDGRINGLMKAQPVTAYCSNKPLSTPLEAKDKIEAKKPLFTPLQAEEKVEPKKSSSTSTSTQAKEKGEGPLKPPHPDSKHLNQLLSVPEVVEWCDFDDQEWLFGGKRNNPNEEKPELGCFEVDGTRGVWAEALRMESADITALPYVIPF